MAAADKPGFEELTPDDLATYEWQLDVPQFGEAGQAVLKNTTALVSRVGGLGSPVAFQLAAAGVGRLILAHGGNLKPSDLNRQITMTRDGLGTPRCELAKATIQRFKPEIEVAAVPSNITEDNAAELVAQADIVFDCAPLFEERFLMNRECVRQGVPLVDAAMYNTDGSILPVIPGETACLACLFPELPPHWRRRFPVIGTTSAMVGTIAVMEGLKLLTDLPGSNAGRLIQVDTLNIAVRKIAVARRTDCAVCGKTSPR